MDELIITQGINERKRFVPDRIKVYRVLRGILRPKGEEWQEAGGDCVMRSFINCTLHKILLG
jgi:hypothetical protein